MSDEEKFWTEEDERILTQLDSEGREKEIREYIGRKVFEAHPRDFLFFRSWEDDPLDLEQAQALVGDERDAFIKDWTDRTLITKWDNLSETEKEDVLWQFSYAVKRHAQGEAQENGE